MLHRAAQAHVYDNHLGPFDLAKQLGVERKGPEHEAAIQRILKAAHSAGKTAAIFCELASRMSRAGG